MEFEKYKIIKLQREDIDILSPYQVLKFSSFSFKDSKPKYRKMKSFATLELAQNYIKAQIKEG